MSRLTSDRNDPGLTHGGDTAPVPQADAYLVLSDEELAKGFVRPLRMAYRHVGPPPPKYPLRDLTEEELQRYKEYGYVKYEQYPQGSPATGKFWKLDQLNKVGKGCGVETRMSLKLCETYATEPRFYGSTYCVGCQMHLSVEEFVWVEDGERVGS